MSVGLFTLQNADVKAVGQELDKIVGDRNTGPLAGILRIIPIERMNALLVITPQPAYLDEAKKWIARLDQGGGGDGPRFYVYNLQNSARRSSRRCCTGVHGTRAPPRAPTPPPTVAPGHAGRARSCRRRRSSRRPQTSHAARPGDPGPRPPGRRGAGHRARRARESASCATSRSSPTRTTTRC